MDDNNTELQPIVKEYLEKQKDSKVTLCIYEEKAGKDVEWIYDNKRQVWQYLKPKKIRLDRGEYSEGFIIETKKFKTFGKKCHITEMSFFNLMAIKATEYYKQDELTNGDVENYIKWYKQAKTQNPELSFTELNELLKQQKSKGGGCLLSVIGFIGFSSLIIFKICGVY